MKLVSRHPLLTTLVSLIVMVLPQIIQPWWSMFSSEPMFPALYAWLISVGVNLPPRVALPWPMLFTVPLGLTILAFVLRAMLVRRAVLEIRFDQRPPHIFDIAQITSYRIGIYNRGPAMAMNVALHLLGVSPTPRTVMFRGDFPYRVTRAVARDALDLEPCQINPEQTELFEVAQSWVTGPPDNRLIINRIDTKAPLDKWPGRIEIERGEEWRCHYRVSSANGHASDFYLMMKPRGDTLSVDLDAGQSPI